MFRKRENNHQIFDALTYTRKLILRDISCMFIHRLRYIFEVKEMGTITVRAAPQGIQLTHFRIMLACDAVKTGEPPLNSS